MECSVKIFFVRESGSDFDSVKLQLEKNSVAKNGLFYSCYIKMFSKNKYKGITFYTAIFSAVFRIRIRMDPVFFADPHPDPGFKSPDPDPSITKLWNGI